MSNDVGNNPHRRFRRIDIGVSHHEFLENVILKGARQRFLADSLLLSRNDVHGEHRQYGAIHGHGDRDLIERDAIEKNFHVFDTVDRNSGFADIADYTGVIRIKSAMGRQIKCDRKSGLPGFEVIAIKLVGLLRSRESGVLSQCPGATGVHGRTRTAQVGREAGQCRQMFKLGKIVCRIERLDGDPLRGVPSELGQLTTFELFGGQTSPVIQIRFVKCHRLAPAPGMAPTFRLRFRITDGMQRLGYLIENFRIVNRGRHIPGIIVSNFTDGAA